MNIGEQLLTALSIYGLPILTGVVYIGCLGVPLPNALLLIASGSFIAGGQMQLWPVLIAASAASIAGDQTGYWVGRWAGTAALRRVHGALRERLEAAEQSARRWGAWGVFLSRWLITPLGPFVNLVSGASRYPWLNFLMWDILGEVLWVLLYVSLGRLIGVEVQSISALAGDLTWVTVAVVASGFLVWRLQRARRRRTEQQEPVEVLDRRRFE